MVNGNNTKMHDIVMSYIPKKNGGGINLNAPAPIFKGSVPTLKPQSAGNLASPKKKTPVAPSKPETKVQFEQKHAVAAEQKTTVEKTEPVKKTESVREKPKINNTKELVEKNDSLAEVDRENIKISKKKKQIVVSAKTLIENMIDQKLKKSYVNNIVSKMAPTQNPVRSRSNSNNNYRKYNQQFLTTQVFDIEPKKTANSFRDVSFKIDGKKERRSRRKKSRDGKKKSREENKKKRKSSESEIKLKKITPPHLRNDLEKILDGVNIA